jgi:PAS domain S-box-containing protein
MTESPVPTTDASRKTDTEAAPERAAIEVTVEAELLRQSLDAGHAVGWDWDVRSGRLFWFGDLQTMFGLDSTTFLGRMEDFRARVHPEDRDVVSAAVAAAMKRRAPYTGVFRVVTVDGRVRWVSSRGEFLFTPDGSAERMLGIAIDVTDRRDTEQALREKERALTEAQRLAGLGSWEWDPATDTVSWSDELYRLAGRDPSGPAVSYAEHPGLYTPESWARLQAAVEEALRTCRPYELDLEMVLPDGGRRWLLARGEALRDAGGRVVKLRGTVQDITERRRAEQALSVLGRRLIESQEAERFRVARELHDDVGQRLALLSIALDRLIQSEEGSYEELRGQLAAVQTVVHSLSHELHATPLRHLGLARAVRGYCAEVATRHDVEVSVQESGELEAVSPDVSLCVFRVLQESLRNAVRHSGVRQFVVELSGESDAVSVSVRDGGVGFDAAAALSRGSLGLASMQERLKLVNGELTIDSGAGRGTLIRARAPRAAPGPDR